MHRRHFLAASGMAAATPSLALAATVPAPASAPETPSNLVNFTSDGLHDDPREYARLLHEIATTPGVEADNYSLGGEIAKLEALFAERLGKQAAMFVPTGTLANHLAVRGLAGVDRRVLVQAESHLYNDSGDGASTLSGLNLVPLGEGRSTITLDEIKSMVERSRGGRVQMQVGAISIETPVRRQDHTMVDLAELDRICDYAREQGIRLHLDGARMFNLPQHSGRSVREYAARFDTVFVSLWKHFNGASGAILAGDSKFIDGLFHTRRMFGGSLPQAWPLVAPVARHVAGYEERYAQAWRVADQAIDTLKAARRIEVRKLEAGTSLFYLTAPGVDGDRAVARALERGVQLSYPNPDSGEFALMVNTSLLRQPAERIAQTLVEALGG